MTGALKQTMWYSLTNEQRANLLEEIAYTLTTGDDYLIAISCAAREAAEREGIAERAIERVLMAAANAARMK